MASAPSAGRTLLSTSRAGITRAGRANGQSMAEERRALQFMTPGQIRQSANRLRQATNNNRR